MGKACSMYGQKRSTWSVLEGNLYGRDRLEEVSLDGRKILKRIINIRNWNRRPKTGYIAAGQGRDAGHYKQDNEFSS